MFVVVDIFIFFWVAGVAVAEKFIFPWFLSGLIILFTFTSLLSRGTPSSLSLSLLRRIYLQILLHHYYLFSVHCIHLLPSPPLSFTILILHVDHLLPWLVQLFDGHLTSFHHTTSLNETHSFLDVLLQSTQAAHLAHLAVLVEWHPLSHTWVQPIVRNNFQQHQIARTNVEMVHERTQQEILRYLCLYIKKRVKKSSKWYM